MGRGLDGLVLTPPSGRRCARSLFVCGCRDAPALGGDLLAEMVENNRFSGGARVNFTHAFDLHGAAHDAVA